MTREEKMEALLKRILHNCAHPDNCEWTGYSFEVFRDSITAACVDALKKEPEDIIWGDPGFKVGG